jgi:hypothetical protein
MDHPWVFLVVCWVITVVILSGLCAGAYGLLGLPWWRGLLPGVCGGILGGILAFVPDRFWS